jgi:YD repeat-containing protein
LIGAAQHPSLQYTAYATNWFTNAAAPDSASTTYDGNGNITQRTWRNGSNQVVRTQTLTWDARDRLMKVTDLDASNTGYVWTAAYDGLGRRLRTRTVPTNGTALVTSPTTIDSYYDPQVEFLELGVNVNGQVTWKNYGPDLNGKYGGLQGVGGLEVLKPDASSQSTGVLQDHFGHVVAGADLIVSVDPRTTTGRGPVVKFNMRNDRVHGKRPWFVHHAQRP